MTSRLMTGLMTNCANCFYHEEHTTPYHCRLQQLISRGEVRIFFHEGLVTTYFYPTTTYNDTDRPYTYSEAPWTPQEIKTVGPFRVFDLAIDFGNRKIPERLQYDGRGTCRVVIHHRLLHEI